MFAPPPSTVSGTESSRTARSSAASVARIGRADQEIGRAAHPHRGARRERRVAQELAAHAALDLRAPVCRARPGDRDAHALALEQPEQLGADGGDVAGAEGEDDVARPDPLAARRRRGPRAGT